MEHIAHNGHLAAFQASEALLHGVHIQQRLGGMRVPAVAAVDHRCAAASGGFLALLRHQVGRAGAAVPYHNNVHAHRQDRSHRVYQRLSFDRAAGLCREIHHVRAQHLCRQLKGHAGAGGGFVKERHHSLAPQRRHLLDVSLQDLLHAVRSRKDELDLFLVEVVQVEHVMVAQAALYLSHAERCSTNVGHACLLAGAL